MSYKSKLKGKDMDLLVKSILLLEDEEECRKFLDDLCTVNELRSFAQRIYVAKLLKEHKTYVQIEDETKASTATISRINKCLEYGADGYKKVLKRMDEQE